MIPLSKLKKSAKARFSGSGPKPDKGESGTRATTSSLLRPTPHVDHESETDPISSLSLEHVHALHRDNGEQDATEESRSDRKSTVSATAKLLLYTVRDSADAFPPLKSVSGGLCSILDNIERTQANEQAIQSLAPRIKSLAKLLCVPVSEDNGEERSRRKELERKLEGVHQDLTFLAEQGKIKGFLNNVGNADKLGNLLEDIRDAIIAYQTSLQQDIYDKSCRLIESTDLVLLDRMQHTTGAGYLSRYREGCLKGTRKDVLWQIERWLTDEQDHRVFWLNGLAGTGKSTIAQTFAETSFADGKLGASFFCSRDFEDRSNIQAIFPTLAFQLAHRYPEFLRALIPVLRVNPEIGQESLCSQLEKVIIGPFKAVRIPTLIIIDALDECKDDQPASAVLSVLSRYIGQIMHVKFFITGRPEPRVRTGFRLELLQPITEVLKLHDVERSSVDSDIKLFLGIRLNHISKTRSDCDFTENWPSSYDIDLLCKKSAGLFIYASTVVKFIASPYHLPTERLTLVVSLPQSTAHEGKSGIDLLYIQVLEQAFGDADSDDSELYSRFKLIVGAVLLVFYPLSRKTLSELLETCGTPSRISNTLRSLHSLLLVPASEVDPIRVFHKSFPDFLTNPGRCKDKRFFVDPSLHHVDIFFSCLNLMQERLKRNICKLDGCPVLSEVKDLPTRREACIGSALEYACRFWTKHLMEIPGDCPLADRILRTIDQFFTTQLLFWIEVLSLTGNLSLGIYALHDIDQWYTSAWVSCQWTSDSQRLILLNFDDIYNSPTKIYSHALPFCSFSSWLHQWYTAESLQGVDVVEGRPSNWGTCSRTVSFEHLPETLACHKDIVTVGLGSGDMVILDAITGSRKSILPGHTDSVISLAFSLDGTLLVSGSRDNAVKLWDTQTGGVVKTFHDAVYRVSSVSISPDSMTIASGSHDDVICLWDVRTGKRLRVIQITKSPKGHAVTCVAFLPTIPGHLMSVSSGHSIQKWDMKGRKIGPQIFGLDIAFSSDGSRFVLCDKGPPTIRNTDSATIIATLRSPGRVFSRCCFSPSDRFVAGVADNAVCIWEVANMYSDPNPIGTFVPHNSKITSLLYSSSLISAYNDKTIRFWQTGGHSPDPAAVHRPKVVYFTLQSKESIATSFDSIGEVRIWDLSKCLVTSFHTFRTNIYVADARLVNKAFIILFCSRQSPTDWKISVWDPNEGNCLQTTTLLNYVDQDVEPRISGDGARVFKVGKGYIYTWSASTGRREGQTRFPWPDPWSSPSVVVDGPVIWVYSGGMQTGGWNLEHLESAPITPSHTSSNRHRLTFVQVDDPEKQYVNPTRIVDTVTRKHVFQFPGKFAHPSKTKWDGQYFVATYNETGEFLILDFTHATPH